MKSLSNPKDFIFFADSIEADENKIVACFLLENR